MRTEPWTKRPVPRWAPLALALTGGICMRTLTAAPIAARDLGIPITAANVISYRTARGLGQDSGDLLCWVTTAESGGHFSAMDLGSGSVLTYPLTHLEGYPIVFGSDRRVYIGSTTGEVMRWDPRTRMWGALGKPLFAVPGRGVNHVRCLVEGRGGWLYAGSCTGERARIHLETAEIQRLPAPQESGNWYVNSVAALPDGRIAFGFGHVARLLVYDPETGQDAGQWMPQGWTEDGFCINLLMARTVLYASHFPSGRRAAFDSASGRFLGKLPWPDAVSGQQWSRWIHSSGYGSGIDFYAVPGTDTVINCDGDKVYQFDPTRPDLPAAIPVAEFAPSTDLALEMRWALTTDCRVLEYDAKRLRILRTTEPPQPKVARGLHGLGTGPDGKVYGGAFQSTQLFRCDPVSGRAAVLGDHHPGWSGETYSFAVRGAELICASYTNGAIVAYDPVKPWQCELRNMVNPRFLGFLGQRVYRPLNTCVAEDGKIWAVGPAGWGSTGGGVAYVDPVTRRTGSTALPEAPGDVVPLAGNRLLVCSGGLLRWWDGTANTELAQAAPPLPLVSATLIEAGPPGRVLFAAAGELAVVSADQPGSVEVVKRHPLPVPCTRALVWKERAVVGGAKGFAVVDLATGAAAHFCSTRLGHRWAYTVAADAVFFHSGAHLMTAAIPPAVP